jgi:hypothetical protein
MPELDHLIFAAADLDTGVARIEELTGATAVLGGPHPGVGTHNALLTFDATTYFEVIAIDPNQPDPPVARPFGLDDGAEPRLAGYAVHPAPGETIDDVVALLKGAGHDPGPVTAMSRVKPDGEEISWRLTRSMAGPAPSGVPFAIDWGGTPSPARSLPSMGHLIELRVHHPDPTTRAVALALGLGLTVTEGPARLTAVVDTPSGRVEIA